MKRTLAHRSKAGTAGPEPTPITAVSGMPAWAFVLVAIVTPSALLISTPVDMIGLGLLWGAYLYFLFQAPERTIFVFLSTMLVIKLSGVPGLPLLRGMNSDTLFIASLLLACWFSSHRQDRPEVRNPLFRPVLYMIVLLVISAMISYGTASAQQHAFAYGWFPVRGSYIFSKLKTDLFYLVLGPIAFRLLWNLEQLRTAVYFVSFYVATVSLDALASRNRALLEVADEDAFTRAYGTLFNEPNVLGGFLALAVVCLAPIAIIRGLPLLGRITTGAALAIGTAGLIYSFSRGAWIAALGGFVLLGLLRGGKGVVALFLLAMTFTIWVPQAVIDRYEQTVRKSEYVGLGHEDRLDRSTVGRMERLMAMPGLFIESPLYGHGYASFPRVRGELNEAGGAVAAHSAIAEIAVEEGVLGLIGYFWILGIVAHSAWRLRKTSDDPFVDAVATGVLVAVCTLVLLDVTGRRFFQNGTMAPIWLLAGGVCRVFANDERVRAARKMIRPVSSRRRPGLGREIARNSQPFRTSP